ncbi:hypothetical protein ACE1TI_03095 [Alteribacillus sp. JSM 102045]|uniref:hypothetical protein n=1 Tax=Alteribacillus sp. JSM 102045 TaxID=1562101 RepID=UPI0035C0DBD2
MNWKLLHMYIFSALLLLVSCSQMTDRLRNCPDAAISWMDVLKIDDLPRYE